MRRKRKPRNGREKLREGRRKRKRENERDKLRDG